jgi:predicted phage tail component-like protein
MYDLKNIDVTKFYFNGNFSDYYEVDVAGINGFESFNLTPAIITKTETIDGVDGEFEVSSQYAPRTFTLPIYIKNNSRLREISAWLGSKTEKPFFFANDKIKLNAKIDSLIDIKHYIQGGLGEIKFKCSNPYYEEINQTKYIITKNVSASPYNFDNLMFFAQNSIVDYINFTDNVISIEVPSLSDISVYNDGNIESKPLIKLYGNGDMTIGINGIAFTIKSVVGYVEIDFKYFDVYKDDMLMLSNFTTLYPITIQDFNMIPAWNSISCSSNVTKIEVTPRSRWI